MTDQTERGRESRRMNDEKRLTPWQSISDAIGQMSEGELDKLLVGFGVDLSRMQEMFDNRPKNESFERLMIMLDARPELLLLVPPAVMKLLLRYIGADGGL
jgi:hypothetical protein